MQLLVNNEPTINKDVLLSGNPDLIPASKKGMNADAVYGWTLWYVNFAKPMMQFENIFLIFLIY